MLRQKKITPLKQSISIAMILAIILIIIYILFSNFFGAKLELNKPISLKIKTLNLPPMKAEFKTEFLNQPPYQDLILNVELPISAGEIGRANPFEKVPFFIAAEE
ncbi:MAG TPA: hypothetical protein VJG65_03795 [Patescibacteria group bacterium]|nr:hypothetical protein [Patescibacteria group bacterium]